MDKNGLNGWNYAKIYENGWTGLYGQKCMTVDGMEENEEDKMDDVGLNGW